MSVVDGSFGHPMKLEEGASAPLAGGIMQQGYQCGMLWGATLAAGAQAYRLLGTGAEAEAGAVLAAQRLVEDFRLRNKYIECYEITDLRWKPSPENKQTLQILKFFLKGGPIICFGMTARFAQAASEVIRATFSDRTFEAPKPPVSCAAMLARKMGASEMHAVMAAGFAGGIGLSGSGCGALGAAIWIIGMENGKEDGGLSGFENPKATETIDRFLKNTDYQFECSKIAGRKFETVAEHAGYLQAGGCVKVIEALAAR